MISLPLSSYQKTETWENLSILKELRFKASLSGGKGGQNVNKVNTKIELYWTPAESKLIEEEVKQVLLTKLASKLSQEGELRIVCEEDRSQLKNKEKAMEKFYKLITACFKVQKKRKATKPTKSSVTKRLEGKSKQKTIKANRRKPEL
ncbi:MAG: aminoacyl-tRNA hydrolase [Cytophagaceae bacterium]|nr:aminoacyl-tRNA hydrolase [Cytophagaceae bacterium]